MWRSVRLVVPQSKIPSRVSKLRRPYSSSSSSGGSGKVIFGIIATAGAGFAGAIVYGKYDPKFKKLLEENIPYISYIYNWFPDGNKKSEPPKEFSVSQEKSKDVAVAAGLLKKKLDREKAAVSEGPKPATESKSKPVPVIQSKDDKILDEINIVKKSDIELAEVNVEVSQKSSLEHAFHENLVSETIKLLEKVSDEAVTAHKTAVKAVKEHTKRLYAALDLSEANDEDIVWKEANRASTEKNKSLMLAKQKASEAKTIIEKLDADVKKIAQSDANNPLVKSGEDCIAKTLHELRKAEAEITVAETQARTAAEYENLINASKEQFRRELQIVVPNYVHGDKGKSITEGDLNLLIAHAHRRIEQLQKQLAKQQVTEKLRVDEAVRLQKIEDDKVTDSKVEAEIEKRRLNLEALVTSRVVTMKENFESELRQQLSRQAAAHADHLQEVLKVQEQELGRKYSLELEEKLLHQKGVFISEISGNMARLKGILSFLKAKSEFDKASKKAQALWLSCQAMNYKITSDMNGSLSPLGKDIAAIKIAVDEDNEFVNSVLASVPPEAVTRGVYTNEILKQRFEKVKSVCRKVALIDENNDSLYRYLLSYLQSFLVVDAISIPKEELEGKVAVDPSEWDTFDILCRISHCLKIDDMEQALRYANQLKGEPRVVAADWMREMRLLLETQLAVKALLAHAAAVGVQAYH